jgi:flagellar hook-basal body complex protein FliE
VADINGIDNRISLHMEPVSSRVYRRDPAFAQRLKAAVSDVNDRQHTADDAVQAVIKGEMGIHEGMLALGRASTSLKLLAAVRNKAMTAYDEIKRMQV